MKKSWLGTLMRPAEDRRAPSPGPLPARGEKGLDAVLDVVCANFYPYWEEVNVDNAIKTLHQQYQTLQAAYPDKHVIVAETGWPSSGDELVQAGPSSMRRCRGSPSSVASRVPGAGCHAFTRRSRG